MTQEHPITPPPDLVRHWSRFQGDTNPEALWLRIANEAAQWGADQELEACCKMLYDRYDRVRHATGFPGSDMSDWLRAARRPKPPSLKEQALAVLTQYMTGETILTNDSLDTIRRALEALND